MVLPFIPFSILSMLYGSLLTTLVSISLKCIL
ncbi:hypothetical protein [Enterococcus phage vB_Efs8_KEN04]|uniref:Uncharacterized protein n=1 Tax=Enterococcus phage vB_Efs6_KEN16 TaxID=3138325 RepID=A0AAX4PSC2_9CAUD